MVDNFRMVNIYASVSDFLAILIRLQLAADNLQTTVSRLGYGIAATKFYVKILILMASRRQLVNGLQFVLYHFKYIRQLPGLGQAKIYQRQLRTAL